MTRQSKKQIQNQAQTEYMQSNELQIAGGEAGKKNRIKTHSQSGRSMVEMLGVLAVIAVLSIGGIVGYRLAMNHYQASQIAHEMNIMRTDAQIKIAQGTENLTLGAPYDEHKINFNGYETAFGCKYVDENDIISDETVSCQIANAYFIELPKIPDGVCQPLARLINGMDNLIAFSVNDSEYEEGGTCQEGENDLYAVFSGETVSDLTHCEGDDDCKELESTPYCDLSRHVCVECTEEKGCEGESEYCEDNVCKTCDSGVWDDESKECVECLTYENCIDTPETPQCDEASHTCKSCIDIDLSKPVWAETQCVECVSDQNCIEKDTNNPVCNLNTNTCEPCPNEGEAWNEEQQKCTPVVCTTNAECFEHLDQNYYCDKTPVDACGENETGICKKFELDLHGPVNGVSIDASAKIVVNYWNNCRICEANAGQDGADCSKNDYLSPYMLTTDFLDCADRRDPSTFHKQWFCHENSTGGGEFDKGNISHNIQDLRELFRCPRLPEPNKNICKVSPNLAVYNPDYPCDAFRIGLAEDYSNPGGFGWGDMGFCLASVLGGRQHPHGGIICKKH